MQRGMVKACLLAVWVLGLGVIWQQVAEASTPVFQHLGQINDNMRTSTRIDLDAAGNLYVAEPAQRMVIKYDRFGKRAAVFTEAPVSGDGLAVSADGRHLYVANRQQVAVLDTETRTIIGYLGGPGYMFGRVVYIEVDDEGYIYVGDAVELRIKIFRPTAPTFPLHFMFGSRGDGPGQFQGINGILVDNARNRIYVTDPMYYNTSKPEMLVFTLGGQFLKSFPGDTSFGTIKLTYFAGLTFDHVGRLYVCDGFLSGLYAYLVNPASGTPTALTQVFSYVKVGYYPSMLVGPRDTAFDPVTQRLFVATEDGRIEIFGIDGGFNPVAPSNVAPTVPVPVAPGNDGEVTVAEAILSFQPASDADGDPLSYEVKVFNGATEVAAIATVAGDGATQVTLTGLPENARLSWQVRAWDGTDHSAWSELAHFYFNAADEAPSTPALVSPLLGEVYDGAGVLQWGAATDPDPFDAVDYLVQVASDAAFAELAAEATLSWTAVALADLPDYGDLVPGQNYFWRVLAVDSDGLLSAPQEAPGLFRYDTSVLTVTATMPGARVFLGGNLAYPGRYLADAPVTLRDLAAGTVNVVVERAGFEPYAAAVEVLPFGKPSLHATLVAAILPADLKVRPLSTAAGKVDLGESTAPFVTDLDGDGVLDVLAGDGAGVITLFPGSGAEPELLVGAPLAVAARAGATPFLVDWDNDGDFDLLVGSADGTLSLFRASAGAYAAAETIEAVGAALSGAGWIVPVVADLDQDGRKDLVVGAGNGQVYLFLNRGTDAAPAFTTAQPLFAAPFAGATAPFLADWDADGTRDLLVAADGNVYFCSPVAAGALSYTAVQMVNAGTASTAKKGKGEAGLPASLDLGTVVRFFAVDFDGANGKDLVVGNAAGELRLAVAQGSEKTAAFRGALLDKLDEIEGDGDVLALAVAGEGFAPLRKAIETGKDGKAAELAAALALEFASEPLVAQGLAEIADVLK